MKYNKIILEIFTLYLILCSINIVNAETIIYDNITTTQYKTLIINDDLNYKILTDYKYNVYINNAFAGQFAKDELIYFPDNSTILIYVPAPMSLDYGSAWDLGKTTFAFAIMFLITFGITIFVIIYFFRKILRKR